MIKINKIWQMITAMPAKLLISGNDAIGLNYSVFLSFFPVFVVYDRIG
jgi:hypothetical protein